MMMMNYKQKRKKERRINNSLTDDNIEKNESTCTGENMPNDTFVVVVEPFEREGEEGVVWVRRRLKEVGPDRTL